MVGGKVIERLTFEGKKVWINCQDNCGTRCALYVVRDENSEKIKVGDTLWWQGEFAMWTPKENVRKVNVKAGVDYDIKIKRIGYSGVPRP
jgi:hypothetical protein